MVRIRVDALKLKILLAEDFIGVMDLNLINSYVSLYDITRELRIPPLSTICAISLLFLLPNRQKIVIPFFNKKKRFIVYTTDDKVITKLVYMSLALAGYQAFFKDVYGLFDCDINSK